MNDFNFTTDVESLDTAALLVTLGFNLKEVKVVNHINLNTDNHTPRPISASWHFEKTSPYCPEAGDIQKVLKRYAFPYLGEEAVNVYQLAKIAAHNYQVLKSVILKGEVLQQKEGPNYVVLKNNNGDSIDKELIYGSSCDISSIAIAAALGCKVSSYCIVNDRLYVNMLPSKDGITLKMLEDMKQDQAIANELNFNTLPVLVAMFINRDILKKEIYEQTKSVMITRGDKLVMFNKNASDKIKHQALTFINE
jgi:hypothetical protein